MPRDHDGALVVRDQRALGPDVLGRLVELLLELLVELLLRRRLEWRHRRRRLTGRRGLRFDERDLAVVVPPGRRDLTALLSPDLVLRALERAQRVHGLADEVDAAEVLDQPVDLPAHLGRGDVKAFVVSAADENDKAGIGVVTELVAKLLGRNLRLRFGIGEARCLQVLLHAATQDPCDDDENRKPDQDRLRAPPGEICNPVGHGQALVTRATSARV